MVDRVAGPFEYFEVTGASIAASADDPTTHAQTLGLLADDLELDGDAARAATEGDIDDMVASNPKVGAQSARDLAQKAWFASGCLRDFGRCVDRFDATVAQLNTEYNDAVKASQTDLGELLLDPLGGPEAVVESTRQRLESRYRTAEGTLDDEADRVAGLFDHGVTDEAVRRLVRQGLIPLIVADGFDHLELTPADRYLALAAMVAGDTVPPEVLEDPELLDAYLVKHHDAADAIASVDPELLALLLPVGFNPTGRGAVEALDGMTAAERRRVALLLPGLYGNNPDAPFDVRAQANRTVISAQIHRDRERIDELKQANEDEDGYGYAGAMNVAERNEEIKRLEGRQDLYDSLLNDEPSADADGRAPEHRQIILFDAAGDGRIAEVSGVLDEHTRNVAVSVPGTTSDLDGWNGTAERGDAFVRDSSGLAVISWMGGDLPDTILFDAPNQKYAKELAPDLSDFSHQLRHEMNRVGATGADTTYLGHSYGAAVVGQAEHLGLDADRVLMVEGAGMGPDVHDVDDLSERNQSTQHYSMTAPGDLIEIAQWSGHLGTDPDDFGNTIRLQTGRFDDGDQIRGVSSHTSVFTKDSDAWLNMLAVMNGGTAQKWHEPDTVYNGYGYSVIDNPDSGGEVQVR